MGPEFQGGQMKRALETGGGDGCTAVSMHLKPLNSTVEMVKMLNVT